MSSFLAHHSAVNTDHEKASLVSVSLHEKCPKNRPMMVYDSYRWYLSTILNQYQHVSAIIHQPSSSVITRPPPHGYRLLDSRINQISSPTWRDGIHRSVFWTKHRSRQSYSPDVRKSAVYGWSDWSSWLIDGWLGVAWSLMASNTVANHLSTSRSQPLSFVLHHHYQPLPIIISHHHKPATNYRLCISLPSSTCIEHQLTISKSYHPWSTSTIHHQPFSTVILIPLVGKCPSTFSLLRVPDGPGHGIPVPQMQWGAVLVLVELWRWKTGEFCLILTNDA